MPQMRASYLNLVLDQQPRLQDSFHEPARYDASLFQAHSSRHLEMEDAHHRVLRDHYRTGTGSDTDNHFRLGGFHYFV